ncbi:MAG: hypothetical protein AAF363_09450 [Bacteroidota bacterium]
MITILARRLISFLLIVTCSGVYAQVNDVWYWYYEGTKKQWDISEKEIKTADWPLWSEDPQWENQDKKLILKRLDNKLLTKEADADYYKVLEFKSVDEDGQMAVFSYPTKKSEQEAMKDFQESKDENFVSLFSVPLFDQETSEKLESGKGLEEITREELIELLNARKGFGKRIEQMLNDHKEDKRLSSQMVIYRISQNLFQKEAIKMGYNPYKPISGNPLSKFDDDEEIQKMMNEPLVDLDN